MLNGFIKISFLWGPTLAIFFLLFLSTGDKHAYSKQRKYLPLETVNNLDIDKYMGKWYEIAKITRWFQKDCVGGTTAEYSLDKDGSVKVINKCVTKKGNTKEATGKAWIKNKKSNSKLKVSFLPGGLKLFAGDYWVIDLDKDYKYAVVGHPSRKFGWILSRTPEINKKTLNEIIKRLEDNGYNFDDFDMTDQKNYIQ